MDGELSRKIKELRLSRNMTLEQVANIVGVGKSTVRKWETGMIANMGRDKIASLAKALGTTPAYLMGWKEENDNNISPNEPKHTEGETLLLDLFKQLPEGEQQMYIEVLRARLKK
jgi:transcriptional regulator with XRE-family HTH domain